MLRPKCYSKIHKATVTEANINYRGSITIDEALMEAADLHKYDEVRVNSYRDATSWITYVLPGERHSGVICLNGPPARLFEPGDNVVILLYVQVTPEENTQFKHITVYVDEKNRVMNIERNVAGE